MIKIKPLNKAIKYIRIIKPKLQSNLLDELNECLRQLDSFINLAEKTVLLKISIFIKSKDISEFNEKRNLLKARLTEHFGSMSPVISYIPEPSADKFNLVFESVLIDNSRSDYHIDFYHNPQTSYYIIANDNFEEIHGVSTDINIIGNGIYNQSSNCFNAIEDILKENGLTFSDIHRQWSYIGQINDFTAMNGKEFENYQQFNISRARYYSKCDWKNGFPAATGIGANIAGCTIEFTASPFYPSTIVIPLHNPKQQDAHQYSEKYQPEEMTLFQNNNHENTPKFERGKIVINNNSMDVYISGTAAILGEDSINQTITEQTEITLQNIKALYSIENLLNHGLEIDGLLPEFSHLRVYIKKSDDYLIVKDICNKFYPGIPLLIVVADVCRKELLVEIEAYANRIIERI